MKVNKKQLKYYDPSRWNKYYGRKTREKVSIKTYLRLIPIFVLLVVFFMNYDNSKINLFKAKTNIDHLNDYQRFFTKGDYKKSYIALEKYYNNISTNESFDAEYRKTIYLQVIKIKFIYYMNSKKYDIREKEKYRREYYKNLYETNKI